MKLVKKQPKNTSPTGNVRQAVGVVVDALERRCLLSGNPPDLGINIRRLGYDSGDQLFADAMKEANTWTTNLVNPADTSTPAPIGPNGWPMTDAGIEIVKTTSDDGGTYALSFIGQATVSPIATEPGVQVTNLSYDPSSNITTGQVIVPNGGEELMLDFTNTRRLPTDTTATGITTVQLMRPSAPDSPVSYSPGTVFTTPILNLISNFTTIRYMDYSLTNSNSQVNWSDRTVPSQVQTDGRGGSWEYAVALANQTGKDMWINIPEMATNQYITNLAELISYGSDGTNPYTGPAGSAVSAANPNPVPAAGPVWAALNSNLRVYVEYSNEVWNTGFAQYGQNLNAAIAEVNAGGSPLNYDGSTSQNVWAPRRNAERTLQTSNIFRGVFGDSQMMTRIRPVYEWQFADQNESAAYAMTFLNNYYNNADGAQHVADPHPVNYYLWGAGGAWYGGVVNPSGVGDAIAASPTFSTPLVKDFASDPPGSPWGFSGATGIAANGSSLQNPNATAGTQAAFLQPGGSFSETVNFTGGLADLYFTAASIGSLNLSVTIDGVDVSTPWTLGAAYNIERTAVFNTGVSNGPHTIQFAATTGSGTIFISNILPETVNGMYNPGILDITSNTLSESSWATAFGLQMVSYEGGFNFGYGNGTPLQLDANQDPRAEQASISQMDEFFASGGALGAYYDTTDNIWALTLDINNQNTPKMQAVQAVLAAPQVPLNVGATLPTVAGQSVTIANVLPAYAGAAGIYEFNAPAAGTYSVTLAGKQSGSAYEQFILDGQTLPGTISLPSTPGNSSPLTFTISTPGLHALLLVIDGSGTVTPSNPAGAVTITNGVVVAPPPPTISGTVFNDANRDGVQDNGESGAAGVVVYEDPNYNHKLDLNEQSVVTDANGNFTFTNLPTDPEILRIVLPGGAQQTFPANGAGIYVGPNTGQTLAGENFGIYTPPVANASISGVVYNDADQDGVQDNGEAGVAGITVYIDSNSIGSFIPGDPTASTGANGAYTFNGLLAGSYVIRAVVPAGDSQITPANNGAIALTLATSQAIGGENFGLTLPVAPPSPSISGTVFNDANHDGVQDNGETGLAGVLVYEDPNYNRKADPGEQSVVTDAGGNYIFTNLPADPEILRIVLPGGAQQTFPAGGAGIYVGKNTGQTLTGENFGIFVPVVGASSSTITGSVFNDLNGDHAQTSNEPNLAGQIVFIDANNNGRLDAGDPTAVTNSSGSFAFTGLAAGTYTVFVSPSSGFRQTLPTTGGTRVTVAANGTVSAGKFGVTSTAYVGGTLFNDLNGNGVQNAGEGALSGYKVYIDLNNDGKFESNEPTSISSSVGFWYFRSVAPGTYTIRVVTPSGWTMTHAYTVTLGSGANVTNGTIGARKG